MREAEVTRYAILALCLAAALYAGLTSTPASLNKANGGLARGLGMPWADPTRPWVGR